MKPAVFWFRRDLRLDDNHGLFQALKAHKDVIPLFIFDRAILGHLTDKKDRRVDFIHQWLVKLDRQIKSYKGSGLLVLHGEVKDCWTKIISQYSPGAVYCNHDYEPQAIKRDLEVEQLLAASNIHFYSYKDQVLFEEDEVLKEDGSPYKVFTSYKKKWQSLFKDEMTAPFPSLSWVKNFTTRALPDMLSLEDLGFEKSSLSIPTTELDEVRLGQYDETRDFPALDATSRQSVHLRFGTISVRGLVTKAYKINETFLSELIWREFFMMVLYHFPQSVEKEFNSKYSAIRWRYDVDDFKKWCFGKTGYPIVDAGMRELNETGFMHNRVRMVTASFLVKHLLIDWRWGERYFAKKLLDFDLAANIGNWQWAAGTGCDAAPYFRIFNPYTQTDKFDKDRQYISQWVPEYLTSAYPQAMVDHKEARARALRVYKQGIEARSSG